MVRNAKGVKKIILIMGAAILVVGAAKVIVNSLAPTHLPARKDALGSSVVLQSVRRNADGSVGVALKTARKNKFFILEQTELRSSKSGPSYNQIGYSDDGKADIFRVPSDVRKLTVVQPVTFHRPEHDLVFRFPKVDPEHLPITRKIECAAVTVKRVRVNEYVAFNENDPSGFWTLYCVDQSFNEKKNVSYAVELDVDVPADFIWYGFGSKLVDDHDKSHSCIADGGGYPPAAKKKTEKAKDKRQRYTAIYVFNNINPPPKHFYFEVSGSLPEIKKHDVLVFKNVPIAH